MLLLAIVIALSRPTFGQNNPAPSTNDVTTARLQYQKGNFDAALAALDRADKSSSPSSESLDLRGCVYMEQEKLEDARKAFDDAHRANPRLFLPRLHLGDLLLRQKKFTEARSAYETLLTETNILTSSERLRFGILLTYLGEHDETKAQKALQNIPFPTETPSYYYAQAAWGFAHDKKSEAEDWIDKAGKVFPPDAPSWFAYHLYHLGWLKKKPALLPDHT